MQIGYYIGEYRDLDPVHDPACGSHDSILRLHRTSDEHRIQLGGPSALRRNDRSDHLHRNILDHAEEP